MVVVGEIKDADVVTDTKVGCVVEDDGDDGKTPN